MKLSGAERVWLEKILESLIPPGGEGGLAVSALESRAAGIFEDMVHLLPSTTGLGLRAAVLFIEFMGPAFGLRRPGRFSRLDLISREQCLAMMSKSDVYLVRNMVLLIKSAACLGWGGDDRVREALGYSRPARFVGRGSAS